MDHAVPTNANIEEVIKRHQSSTRSLGLISLPNIFRWKATGNMMQIVKHKADPISAIIRSNEGNSTAMITMLTTTRMRIKAFESL